MPTFRTKIAHKKGSEIEIFGHIITMEPDEGQGDPGLCTFDIPDARDDVFARLIEIPEGFELLGEVSTQTVATSTTPPEVNAGKSQAPSLVITGDGGVSIDLYAADKQTLMAIAKDMRLSIAPATGLEKVREKVISAFKASVKD